MSLLIQKSTAQIVSLPIQKLAAKKFMVAYSEITSRNCVAVDLKIGSQTIMLLIQKSMGKNLSLPIQKSAAKLRRCQLRNQQPKPVLLPIQKSAAKNCVATNSKIDNDGEVISSFFSFFFSVFTVYMLDD